MTNTYRTTTAELPSKKTSQYHAEQTSPSRLITYLYPDLDEADKRDLDNVTVPRNEGWFGKTMKQVAVLDQKKKDRNFEETLEQQHEAVAGRAGDNEAGKRARSENHLADLEGHKRTK